MFLRRKPKKSKASSTGRILPSGYYRIEGETVWLQEGPYQGLGFKFGGQLLDNVKIREDALTGTPQLLYDYSIVDYHRYDPAEVESCPKLSRIIAAIQIELISDLLANGGTIESINGTNQNRNHHPAKSDLQ